MGTYMKSFVFPEQWKLSLNVVASSEDAQITVAKATKGVERQLHLEFFESLEMAKDLKGLCLHKNLNRWFLWCEASPSQISYWPHRNFGVGFVLQLACS
ncbi:hypothetical protein ACFX13_009725 [Malus domestica]